MSVDAESQEAQPFIVITDEYEEADWNTTGCESVVWQRYSFAGIFLAVTLLMQMHVWIAWICRDAEPICCKGIPECTYKPNAGRFELEFRPARIGACFILLGLFGNLACWKLTLT